MKPWIGGELAAYWESGDPFAPVLALASPDESASNSNDLVSRLQQQNSPQPKYPSIPRSSAVVFDSTHFAEGTDLSIVFEAWTNTGYLSASESASVKNAALLYGRMEFEQGVNPMEHGVPSGVETLGPLNYGLYVATTTPWGWQEMRADLMHCNVFYVNTHSNLSAPWRFWTDRNEASTPVWELIVPWHSLDPVLNMEDAVYEKVGSGIPPFNANQPPFNLVWIDACHTGEDNEFAKAFLWPYINAYNNRWTENQSELGYRIESSTICASASASAFWSALADGWSAYQARIELHSAYRQIDSTCPATPEELIALWGDFATRLHNVYLEDFSVQSTFWKIP